MADIVAIGELLIDFSPLEGGAMMPNPGGAPCNFLAAASRFGCSCAFIGKVGDDAFGHMLADTMVRENVDISGLKTDAECFTTLAFVTVDASGDRSFSFARKPGADQLLRFEEVDCELVKNCRLLHFCGSLSLTDDPCRDAVYRTVALAREQGKLVSFDPNLRTPLWKDLADAKRELLWGCDHADILKLSEEEMEFLELGSPERILAAHPVQLVMLTRGSEGAVLKNARAEVSVPSPEVNVKDTTGAGDIFGGAVMHALLQLGKAPAELSEDELLHIGRFAVTAASLSTEKSGGIPSIPELSQVLARLN